MLAEATRELKRVPAEARVAEGWPATRGSWVTAALVLAYGAAGPFGCRRKESEIAKAGRRRCASG